MKFSLELNGDHYDATVEDGVCTITIPAHAAVFERGEAQLVADARLWLIARVKRGIIAHMPKVQVLRMFAEDAL